METQSREPSFMQRISNILCGCERVQNADQSERHVAIQERQPLFREATLADSKIVEIQQQQRELLASRHLQGEPIKLRSEPLQPVGLSSSIDAPELQQSRAFYMTHQVVETLDSQPLRPISRRLNSSNRSTAPPVQQPIARENILARTIVNTAQQMRLPTPPRASGIKLKEVHQVNNVRPASVPKIVFTYETPSRSRAERQSLLQQLPCALETNPISLKVADMFNQERKVPQQYQPQLRSDPYIAETPQKATSRPTLFEKYSNPSHPDFVTVKSIVQEPPTTAVSEFASHTNTFATRPFEPLRPLNPESSAVGDFRDKFKLSEVVNLYGVPDTISVSHTPNNQTLAATTPKDQLGSMQSLPFPSRVQEV